MTKASPAQHDTISRAIGASGLTIAEIADRAGLTPAQVGDFPLNHVPIAVLGRLAHVLGISISLLLYQGDDDDPEEASDSSTIGAYLAEFRNGLTRDGLAEALDWTLLRVEQALAKLDTTLHHSGMRLGLTADRIVIVGRLVQTDLPTRRSLERLAAAELNRKLAAVVWDALPGFPPEITKDIASLETADRLGFTCARQGRIRITDPVHYSLYPTNTAVDPTPLH